MASDDIEDSSQSQAPLAVARAHSRITYGRNPAHRRVAFNAPSRPRTRTTAFAHFPDLTADDFAASQQAIAPLPQPTPVLSFLGKEIAPDDRDIRKQENVDQTKYRRRAELMATEGWLQLVLEAYRDEQLGETTLSKKLTESTWISLCDEAMAGAHRGVLMACLLGNPVQMAARARSGAGLGPLLTAMQRYVTQAANHASIYVRQLVLGPQCESLTKEEAFKISMVARQYTNMVSDKWEEARTIDKYLYGDRWRSAWSKKGYRALVHNKNAKVNSAKQRVMQTWADALEKEAKTAKGTHIKPLYYVGYAINAQSRQQQHDKMDDSTNDLVRFVDAVLNTADWHDKTARNARMKNWVICLLSHEDVAAPAEALYSRILQSNYFSAGFNIAPCGASVRSVYLQGKSPDEKETYWKACRRFLDLHTDYSAYLEEETNLRRALQRREWDRELAELQRKSEVGKALRKQIANEMDQIHGEVDFDTLTTDPFFAQYRELWQETVKLVREGN